MAKNYALTWDPAASIFPLSIHAGGRYLVNAQGVPFPALIESGWENGRLLPTAQHEYIDAIAALGYTATLNQGPLSLKYTPGGNDAGNPYFNSSSGSGAEGAPIFDLTTPNTAAFANIRASLLYAQSRGVLSLFYPAYTGFVGTQEGILDAVLAATDAQCEAYGVYVGNLIKDIPGIVVTLFGDRLPDATGLEKYRRMVVGLKSVDMAGRIYTGHVARTGSPYDANAVTAGWIAGLGVPFLDTAYSREASTLAMTHDLCLTAYAIPRPVTFLEGYYKGNSQATADPPLLRRQFWGAWLSGAMGSAFGDGGRFNFPSGWQTTLSDASLTHEAVGIAAIKARAWQKLVPNTGTGLVTSGGGTRNTLGYKPRAVASDGSWGAVHVVDGSSTMIDFSLFAATKNPKWLDPASGALTSAGSAHANTGTQAYTPSGSNAAGSPDWLLVIE